MNSFLPILDGGIPKTQDLKDAISRVMIGRTYVHCAQGHGRTGLFTIALLFARGQIQSVEDGLELLKKVRPGVRLNSTQQQYIQEYIAERS
ncbi:MAG: hypothetical protein ACFFCH_11475 [Promethearchaeota archaeon]